VRQVDTAQPELLAHRGTCSGLSIDRPCERVEAGQPAAAIYDIDGPLHPPVIMTFRRSGLPWAMRGQGRVDKAAAAVVVTARNTGR
jgi:hypothetical protein